MNQTIPVVFSKEQLSKSKGGLKLPSLSKNRNSIESLEIRQNGLRNKIISEEIENLHHIAIFYGQKLEQEQEASVRL